MKVLNTASRSVEGSCLTNRGVHLDILSYLKLDLNPVLWSFSNNYERT